MSHLVAHLDKIKLYWDNLTVNLAVVSHIVGTITIRCVFVCQFPTL